MSDISSYSYEDFYPIAQKVRDYYNKHSSNLFNVQVKTVSINNEDKFCTHFFAKDDPDIRKSIHHLSILILDELIVDEKNVGTIYKIYLRMSNKIPNSIYECAVQDEVVWTHPDPEMELIYKANIL